MDHQQLIAAITNDHGLTSKEKESLLQKCSKPGYVEMLLSGGVGAALGMAISKFLKLGRGAQILMTTAGFGVGQIILDISKNNKDSKLLKLNEKTRQYEIK